MLRCSAVIALVAVACAFPTTATAASARLSWEYNSVYFPEENSPYLRLRSISSVAPSPDGSLVALTRVTASFGTNSAANVSVVDTASGVETFLAHTADAHVVRAASTLLSIEDGEVFERSLSPGSVGKVLRTAPPPKSVDEPCRQGFQTSVSPHNASLFWATGISDGTFVIEGMCAGLFDTAAFEWVTYSRDPVGAFAVGDAAVMWSADGNLDKSMAYVAEYDTGSSGGASRVLGGTVSGNDGLSPVWQVPGSNQPVGLALACNSGGLCVAVIEDQIAVHGCYLDVLSGGNATAGRATVSGLPADPDFEFSFSNDRAWIAESGTAMWLSYGAESVFSCDLSGWLTGATPGAVACVRVFGGKFARVSATHFELPGSLTLATEDPSYPLGETKPSAVQGVSLSL